MYPNIHVVLDAEQTPLSILEDLYRAHPECDTAEKLVKAGHLVHITNDAQIDIGGMPKGTKQGNPTVMFAFKTSDDKGVIVETTMALFLSAADALRNVYGDPRISGAPKAGLN
jgi:hypothetical protein